MPYKTEEDYPVIGSLDILAVEDNRKDILVERSRTVAGIAAARTQQRNTRRIVADRQQQRPDRKPADIAPVAASAAVAFDVAAAVAAVHQLEELVAVAAEAEAEVALQQRCRWWTPPLWLSVPLQRWRYQWTGQPPQLLEQKLVVSL